MTAIDFKQQHRSVLGRATSFASAMSTRPSYFDVWRARFGPQRDSCEKMLNQDPFPDWERNDCPEVDADLELTQGLRMLWAGEDEIARRFFERALTVVARAESEKTYREDGDQPFPRNRAALARAKVHAANLLGVMTPADTQRHLSRAAEDYALWCEGYASGWGWDSQAQAYYLNAARLACLAQDQPQVTRLLATRKSFKSHAEERQILGALGAGERSDAIANRLLVLLDRLRDPDYRSPVFLECAPVCLELALIHELHFGAGTPLDWAAAALRVGA